MFISVIIPAYNAERHIRRTVDSVLAQTYKNYEIIIIDDGSTDMIIEQLRSYGPKVTYIRQNQSGPGAARNKGILASKGDWIAFLDSDDEWLPEKLEEQMKLLSANPELKWCGTNSFNSDGTNRFYRGNPARTTKGLAGQDYFKSYFDAVGHRYIRECTVTLVIKREVFDEVGLFDPELLRNEDSDMWCRIAFRYPKFGYINKPLAIINLDIYNPVLHERRWKAKKGLYFRKIVRRHLALAAQNSCLEDYKIAGAMYLKRTVMRNLFNGYGKEAIKTIKEFKVLFPWYWYLGVFLLGHIPRVTSVFFKSSAYLLHRIQFDRSVTRRWQYSSRE